MGCQRIPSKRMAEAYRCDSDSDLDAGVGLDDVAESADADSVDVDNDRSAVDTCGLQD